MTKDEKVNVESNVPAYHLWITPKAAVVIAKALAGVAISIIIGVVSLQVYGIPKWQQGQDERYDKRMVEWSDGRFLSQTKGAELTVSVEQLTTEVDGIKSQMKTGLDEIKAGINDLKLMVSLPGKPIQQN